MSKDMKADKSSPAYLKQSSSGGLFIGFLYVLVFMSIFSLGIWQSLESKSIESASKLFNERLVVIEEQINIADETNNDSLSDISSSIQFLDKEVRKLWDLSNKRNKTNIAKLTKATQKLELSVESINKMLNDSSKLIEANKKDLQINRESINNLSLTNSEIENIQITLKTIETQLILIDDSVQALNNYKKQLNQSISEIQTEISLMNQETIELQE
jgi:chromosome segregation ATPase|tara:strand:+ start:8813 stop:9457 length:645 start_codon:yes stop_codon:yes gene_type:complete